MFVQFYVLLTVHLGIIFVNNQLDAQLFFMYVYFYFLHVSGSHVPIIRRINYINTTSGICHSVDDRLVCRFGWDWFGREYWLNIRWDVTYVVQECGSDNNTQMNKIRCFNSFTTDTIRHIPPDIQSVLPAEPISSKPAHYTVDYTEWHVPDVIVIQLIFLMMGTWHSRTWKRIVRQVGYLQRLCLYLLTYSMEQNRVLEKLTGCQVVKKFPAFYGTWRFCTAFTRAHHLSLSEQSMLTVPWYCTYYVICTSIFEDVGFTMCVISCTVDQCCFLYGNLIFVSFKWHCGLTVTVKYSTGPQ